MDNTKMPAYPFSLVREWKQGNNGEMYAVKDDYEGLSKLEAFTMAAMQSLIINKGISTWEASRNDEGRCDDIAIAAVSIARATLTELSKQQ